MWQQLPESVVLEVEPNRSGPAGGIVRDADAQQRGAGEYVTRYHLHEQPDKRGGADKRTKHAQNVECRPPCDPSGEQAPA
eukprot:scaffold131134_cov30-Tisochrysis_lutea.AAC.3